jgi:hypothetical protein
MPVYLPPLSRREFLSRMLVLSSALGVAPEIFAASRSVDADSWALCADTHIAGDRSRMTREINMADHFKAVARDILSLPRRPSGLIVGGDCALTSGENEDYKTLAELLLPLRGAKLPLYLLLGNHDNREHFWGAFPKAKKGGPPERQAMVVKSGHVNWFLLDSLEKTNSTPGLLGREQIEWLDLELNKRPGRPAIVVAHHNPGTKDSIGGLKDVEELMAVLRARRQVKAFIYGHTHNWRIERDDSGIHLVNLPPTAYVFGEGKPSGWVHARTRPAGMDLELRCVDPAHKLHGQKVELEWRE